MVPELIEVMTTTAEKPDAQSIATMLVEKRFAACVQISGPLESSYWWNDRVETAREWQVVVKTRGDLYGAVEAAIRAVHPYDEPEILALPIVAVSAGYRQWLLSQLALPVKGQTTATEKPGEPSDLKPAPRVGKASDKKQG
jgi:periplasmic divalent cation tolerance protein